MPSNFKDSLLSRNDSSIVLNFMTPIKRSIMESQSRFSYRSERVNPVVSHSVNAPSESSERTESSEIEIPPDPIFRSEPNRRVLGSIGRSLEFKTVSSDKKTTLTSSKEAEKLI